MLVKGKLQSEGSKTSLIANVDGRIFKSWLVDQEGTLHLFTKVNYSLDISMDVEDSTRKNSNRNKITLQRFV